MTELIITADDYCGHPFINRGVEAAVEKKRVNTVSALMNIREDDYRTKSSHDQVKELMDKYTDIKVGIHLTLTSGRPVSPHTDVFSLCREDKPTHFMTINDFKFGKIDPEELKKELQAQIGQFPYPDRLDHLSCHHGVVTFREDFFKVYTDLADDWGVSIRNPTIISSTGEKGFKKISKMERQGIKNGFLMIIDRDASIKDIKNMKEFIDSDAMWERCNLLSPIPPRYFIDTFYGKGTKKRLKQIFKNIPKLSRSDDLMELVVHLGMDETDSEPNPLDGIKDSYFPKREKELETISEEGRLEKLMDKYHISWGCYEKQKNT